MTRQRTLLSLFAALSLLLAIAPPAHAQPAAESASGKEGDVEQARKRYAAGLGLYDDGNYDAARIEFEKAYALAPSYKLLYNVGLCYRQLNLYVESIRALSRYLKEGADQVPADRRAEVQKIINDIQPRIGSVEVKVEPAGADVLVDDSPVGTAPLNGPVFVNPGRRKISAKMAGRQPQEKFVTVGAADVMNVELSLPEVPRLVETNTAPAKIGLYVSLAATAAFAITTGVTGALALSAKNDVTSTPSLPTATDGAAARRQISDASSERHSADTRMKTFGLISDISLGATVVAAGASLYFFIKSRPKERSNEAPATTSSNSWRVGVGPGSLVLGKSF